MTTVTLKMQDMFTEEEVIRTIDISNVCVPNYEAALDCEHDIIGTKEQQEKKLNEWIKERGNEQHNTWLKLTSWEIN